jgi:hypothetical protein
MELAAIVSGLASLAQRGVRRAAVRLRGDSMSVLQWTANSQTTFKSTIARNAAMVFTAIAGRFDYIMSEDWQHISSEANWVCDNLSRNVPITNELTGPEGCQSPASHPYIDEITSLCNPLTNPNTDIQYAERWALIDSTLSTY